MPQPSNKAASGYSPSSISSSGSFTTNPPSSSNFNTFNPGCMPGYGGGPGPRGYPGMGPMNPNMYPNNQAPMQQQQMQQPNPHQPQQNQQQKSDFGLDDLNFDPDTLIGEGTGEQTDFGNVSYLFNVLRE